MRSVPSWARVGAKVACIASGPWEKGDTINSWQWFRRTLFGLPVCGGVYTITAVGGHPSTGGVGIRLKGWGRLVFSIDQFRPLVTRSQEQDIAEHFAHHLRRDVPARERA